MDMLITVNGTISITLSIIILKQLYIFISSLCSQIFNNELFGAVAEEKDIRGIVSKVMEARHSKSSDSYELLGQFCSQERVVHLILPLKEVNDQ